MNGRMRRGSALLLALLLTLTPLVLTAEETADPTTHNTSSANQPSDPLIRILVSKGVLSAEEAKFVGAGTADNQREKLIYLLKEKGLLNAADMSDLRSAPVAEATTVSVSGPGNAVMRPAVYTTIDTKPQAAAKTEAKPAPPKVV